MAKKTSQPAPAAEQTATLAQDTKPNDIAVQMIDVDAIAVENKHDRTWTPELEAEVRSLAASIAERGLQSPIRVHERGLLEVIKGKGKTLTDEPKYALTYGELRLAAVKLLGWKKIPATIGQAADVREDRAVENLQRPELGVGAKMVLIADLIGQITAGVCRDMGLAKDAEIDARTADAIRKRAVDVAQARTGMKAEQIRDLLFLNDLDETTRSLTVSGRLPWTYARKLAAVADPEVRAEIAESAAIETKARPYCNLRTQPIPLSELERKIAAVTNVLDKVPWLLDVAFADAPACNNCPHNSVNQTGLFTGQVTAKHFGGYGTKTIDVPAAGVCLKDSCFRAKLAAFNRSTATAARRVEITVKNAPPNEKASARRDVMNNSTPNWVNITKFDRQVAEKVKVKSDAAASPASAGGASVKKAKSAEEIAEAELEGAMHKWATLACREVNKALKKDPATAGLIRLAMDSEQMERAVDSRKKPKQADVNEAAKLVNLALENDFVGFMDLWKPSRYGVEIYWDQITSDALWEIAHDFKLELPIRPVLEDFLPKPKADEKPAGKASTKSSPKKPRGSTPPSGKKSAAAAVSGAATIVKNGKRVPASESKVKKAKKPTSGSPYINSDLDRDLKQAARDMAADAAGDIDPQEEV